MVSRKKYQLPNSEQRLIKECVSLSDASSYLRAGIKYDRYSDGVLRKGREIDFEELSKPLKRPSLLRKLVNCLRR